MIQIDYKDFIKNRSLLNRPVANSLSLSGFTLFKDLSEAKLQLVNPNLFIVSVVLTQWSETDLYPELIDGEISNAFGYFIAYGKNKQEKCVFEDFPY